MRKDLDGKQQAGYSGNNYSGVAVVGNELHNEPHVPTPALPPEMKHTRL